MKVGVEIVLETEDATAPSHIAAEVNRLLQDHTTHRVIQVDAFDMDAEAAEFLRASLKQKEENADSL